MTSTFRSCKLYTLKVAQSLETMPRTESNVVKCYHVLHLCWVLDTAIPLQPWTSLPLQPHSKYISLYGLRLLHPIWIYIYTHTHSVDMEIICLVILVIFQFASHSLPGSICLPVLVTLNPASFWTFGSLPDPFWFCLPPLTAYLFPTYILPFD